MATKLKPIFKAWWIMAKNNIQNQLLTPSSSILFIIGKFLNFIFSIFIITAIFHQTNTVGGYNYSQVVIFVLVFNFIDTLTQFFFRSLYSFRPVLIKGDFDLDLLRPLPSFFRPILSGPDFLDFPLIFIKLGVLIYFVIYFGLIPSLPQFILFLFIFINAIILTFSLHLIIAAFSVLTAEIDSLVALYRTIGQAAVIPTNIYSGFFRFILDWIIPVTVMFTVPAQALLGILSLSGVVYSSVLSYSFLFFAIYFWRHALKNYTSASS